MEKIVNTIIKNNSELFGKNPNIKKINIGFTNTIYDVNNSFIIKICSDYNNENKFKHEIDFYNSNKNNDLIPKLYYANTEKIDVPYFYEILEKIKGVSLYNVWHTLKEEEREDITKQLCEAMKQIHNNTGEIYDWTKYIKDKFILLFNKANDLNIFTEEENKFLNEAYLSFDKYLDSNKFVLVHNDLHFDNIFYYNGKIKIIDFERSMYAPIDFELDIFYRMIRKPWKFASEETEEYTDLKDYSNIMSYIDKYYKKLVDIPNLSKRLAIYDIVYYLPHLIRHPEIEELKEDILNAASIVIENKSNDMIDMKKIKDC